MIKIAITGNIGTGKSTVSKIIESLGYKVFDSDYEVKKLLKQDNIVQLIFKEFSKDIPDLLNKENKVDTKSLGEHVFANKKALTKLEEILHPIIRRNLKRFLANNDKEKIAFFDIPLLFEKKLHKNYNFIIYTTIDSKTQKKRVLERTQMNEDKYEKILKNQTKMTEKLKKFVSLELNTNQEKSDLEIKIKKFIRNVVV